MLQITEDTPPDMLAGAMDLTVHLPTGRSVKMSVERSTPMMDLLVQITTNHHLQLSGYTLQALGMAPTGDHSDSILPYKPNTPIGALDTQHIKVIPKARTMPVPKNVPPGHQPFESTFRLKVHLPRNQLYVTRVSQSVYLEDIMRKVCEEKNLDPQKYELRHPGNLDEILDPKLTLSDYQITEVYLVSKGTTTLHQTFSTSDIMALRKEEERKQIHNKTGGGVFNLIFRRGKSSTGSLSSENRSISPTHSDDSRSVTPPGVQPPADPPIDRPKPPQRKRRPAPKPPQEPSKSESKKSDTGLTICHSRNSSDSSGYHEASTLSDNCNTSLPRRPKSTMIPESTQKSLSELHSQSTSNLSKMSSYSKSTSSLAVANRKKKAAPPPPPVLKPANIETTLEEPSPVVASQPPIVDHTESVASTGNTSQPTPLDSLASFQSLPSQIESKPNVIEESKNLPENKPPIQIELEEEVKPHTEDLSQKEDAPHVDNAAPKDDNHLIEHEPDDHKENDLEMDWQYQLPSPPKAFRDSSPVVFADAAQESVVDSVVTSPELFEKLKEVKDYQSEKETISDIISVVSEEEKPILNKLSLENLEKRKSLVYNRELATSLKISEEEKKGETFSSSLTKFEKTYEEVRRSSPKESVQTKSTLPNFKITTYDNPKQKLKVFEDDTIRSNTDSLTETISPLKKNYMGRSMENISLRKNSFENGTDDDFKVSNNNYTFYKPATTSKGQFSINRSESFKKEPTWTPSKPVTRSVSQIALNKYKDNKKYTHVEEDNLTKSNSLFDVSGLQSLGVMRLIQNKLNTPNNSTEQLDQHVSYQKQPEVKSEVQKEIVEEKQQVKMFTNQYRVPSINMGTWSERPKIPVNVKEDPDYKYGMKDSSNSKLMVNTINNDVKSFNSIEIRNTANSTFNGTSTNHRIGSDTNNRNINGTETISGQNTGNVLIKIGGPALPPKKPFMRKPLGNVNVDNNHQRPHSIAFGSDFDISRVPIVRSVEFKKPYKEFHSNNSSNNNTSVTQIYQNNNNFKFNTINRTNYNNNINEIPAYAKPQVEIKPVFRVNTYLQNSAAPVVRGFRSGTESNKATWNQPHSFSTLPAKNFGTNKSVPFSQSNLRRTESTKIENTVKSTVPPPPAPALPAMFKPGKPPDNYRGDPKEQLLQAIRDFGGKKGLKAVKV